MPSCFRIVLLHAFVVCAYICIYLFEKYADGSMMKLNIILITFLFLSTVLKGQDVVANPGESNRILFLGNSITYRGLYVTYLETFLTLKHPDRQIEYINVGLPSETVSGLSEEGHAGGAFPRPDLRERLHRVLAATDPDLVFACYGMNDGIYMPFEDTIFQKYRDGMEWLFNEVKASGANIVFLTPPVYDPVRDAAYSNVLDLFSDWLISKRYTDHWEVADLHWPMKKFLEDQRVEEPDFFLAKDGVHPGEQGHWLMAREVLLFLGYEQVRGTATVAEALAPFQEGMELLALVEQRQNMMKNAWLTSTGHTRPRMKTGLPMDEAMVLYRQIQQEIEALLK